MAGVMVLSMTACGGDGGETASNNEDSNAEQATSVGDLIDSEVVADDDAEALDYTYGEGQTACCLPHSWKLIILSIGLQLCF